MLLTRHLLQSTKQTKVTYARKSEVPSKGQIAHTTQESQVANERQIALTLCKTRLACSWEGLTKTEVMVVPLPLPICAAWQI